MPAAVVRRHAWIAVAALVPLLLTGCSKGRTAKTTEGSGLPTIKVSVANFIYSGMPDTFVHGQRAISFTNKESFTVNHEMVLLSLGGKSTADMIAGAKAKGPDAEDEWLHFGEVPDVDTGGTKVALFDLPAGTYAIACYQQGTPQGKDNGPTHLTIGMIKQFTVT